MIPPLLSGAKLEGPPWRPLWAVGYILIGLELWYKAPTCFTSLGPLNHPVRSVEHARIIISNLRRRRDSEEITGLLPVTLVESGEALDLKLSSK